jgi:hypothetical protein
MGACSALFDIGQALKREYTAWVVSSWPKLEVAMIGTTLKLRHDQLAKLLDVDAKELREVIELKSAKGRLQPHKQKSKFWLSHAEALLAVLAAFPNLEPSQVELINRVYARASRAWDKISWYRKPLSLDTSEPQVPRQPLHLVPPAPAEPCSDSLSLN